MESIERQKERGRQRSVQEDCSNTDRLRLSTALLWEVVQKLGELCRRKVESQALVPLSPFDCLAGSSMTSTTWNFIHCCLAWFSELARGHEAAKTCPMDILPLFPFHDAERLLCPGGTSGSQGPGSRQESGREHKWPDLPQMNTAVSNPTPALLCLTGEQLCSTAVCPSVSF